MALNNLTSLRCKLLLSSSWSNRSIKNSFIIYFISYLFEMRFISQLYEIKNVLILLIHYYLSHLFVLVSKAPLNSHTVSRLEHRTGTWNWDPVQSPER